MNAAWPLTERVPLKGVSATTALSALCEAGRAQAPRWPLGGRPRRDSAPAMTIKFSRPTPFPPAASVLAVALPCDSPPADLLFLKRSSAWVSWALACSSDLRRGAATLRIAVPPPRLIDPPVVLALLVLLARRASATGPIAVAAT